VLYRAIAEAARRVHACVELIDVGCSAGLNLRVDCVGIMCSNGQLLGNSPFPFHRSSSIVGDRPIPTQTMPEVRAQIGVDLDPVGWPLSHFLPEGRLRFLQRLDQAAAGRAAAGPAATGPAVAWVSAEGGSESRRADDTHNWR